MEGLSCAWEGTEEHPWLLPKDVSSSSPVVTIENVSRHCQLFLGVREEQKFPLAENQSLMIITKIMKCQSSFGEEEV